MNLIHQNLFTNNLFQLLIPNKPQYKHTNHIFTCSTTSSSKFNTKLSLSTNNYKSSYDYNQTGFNTNNNNNDTYEYEKGLVGNGNGNGSGQQYARPVEIQWKKELCNSVQLIGAVGTAVEFKQLGSGKVLAWCRLAVKKSATDTTWINLTFWDEIAHIASQHVVKGQQIYVSGRLVSDTVDSDDGKQQTYYKVVVQELKFIERSSPPSAASNDGDFNYNYNSNSNSNSMTTGRKQKNYAANGTGSGTGSVEELWQAFFANPVDWWDNRKNKRSPNYPDFKHKDTGEALWVEGRLNPSWVKSQLSVLDSRMESFHDQTRSDSMFGDNLTPY